MHSGQIQECDILSYNIKVMKILTLWPIKEHSTNKYFSEHSLLLFSFLYPVYALIHGIIHISMDPSENIIGVLDVLIALVAIISMEYMAQCFIRNIKNIKKLVQEIEQFVRYGAKEVILDTEMKIRKYTKGNIKLKLMVRM